MANYRSITQVGTCEPFELQVARGDITGHYRLHKFGFNEDIDDNEETIWDAGGIYSYPTTAVKMTVTSTDSANDSGVQVNIQGLDANYNQVSEVITLDDNGVGETSTFFLRVYRAFIAGSQEPSGTINITNASTTYARITLGENQTLMAVWTVPAGHTAYLVQKDVTSLTETITRFGIFRLVSRAPGGVFRTHDKHCLRNDHLELTYSTPLVFTEKTDIEVRCKGSGDPANMNVSASMDIIYIKNEDWS